MTRDALQQFISNKTCVLIIFVKLCVVILQLKMSKLFDLVEFFFTVQQREETQPPTSCRLITLMVGGKTLVMEVERVCNLVRPDERAT